MRRLPKAKDSLKFFKKTPGEIDAMTLSDFSLNRQTDRQAGWPAVRQSRGACNILPTVDPLCIIRTEAVGGGDCTKHETLMFHTPIGNISSARGRPNNSEFSRT